MIFFFFDCVCLKLRKLGSIGTYVFTQNAKQIKPKLYSFSEKQLTVTYSDHVCPRISECRVWNLAIEYPMCRHY